MSAITISSTRTRSSRPVLARAAATLGSLLAGIAARWSDFVNSGQLGPAADAPESRHFGGRI